MVVVPERKVIFSQKPYVEIRAVLKAQAANKFEYQTTKRPKRSHWTFNVFVIVSNLEIRISSGTHSLLSVFPSGASISKTCQSEIFIPSRTLSGKTSLGP